MIIKNNIGKGESDVCIIVDWFQQIYSDTIDDNNDGESTTDKKDEDVKHGEQFR